MNTNRWATPMTQEKTPMTPWYLPVDSKLDSMTSKWLANIVQDFAPISLQEMDTVELLNRTDTKFVMPNERLLKSLATIKPYYKILTINGVRMNHYRTLYFDTADFTLYNMHVNDRVDRYKVRSREYMESQLSYIEVKHKIQKDRTIKERLLTKQPLGYLNYVSENWLNRIFPYESQSLEPKLWNTFARITLVGKTFCERVTIDFNLDFSANGNTAELNGITIAEVKQDNRCHYSPFITLMRSEKIMPQSFSKYIIGTALLYDQVKKNSLKSKLMWIDKIGRGSLR